jgi:glycosidase
MNPLGTHDTERILTYLAGPVHDGRGRQWQASQKLSDDEYKKVISLLKIASAMQFTLPGVPSIYYGDEAGMEGYRDPFNRACYPWGQENESLIKWYQFLGQLRKICPALKDGRFIPISAALGCISYARQTGSDELIIIANRNEHDIDYYLHEEYFSIEPIYGCTSHGPYVNVPAMTCALLGRGKWM